ncbi:GFA family protein [Chitinimonas koreensis]|uniref:GFA family protein n=1 Tax=Chitinimonas koreensis TaxID=356302 RepID=UPI0004079329|nr:GFA family protein [Chitinimonas koreensis]QNM98230.1 GFA family protein [Chitinimonas koreensis]
MSDIQGQCFCGAVKYRVAAAPKWCAHCHCTMCRQVHSAAFVTWFGVPLEAFELVEGEQALQWFDSSAEARRGFCGRCGTPLLFHGRRWADEMHIARASLREGTVMAPGAHVFYDSHVDWADCGDGLPRYGADGQALP